MLRPIILPVILLILSWGFWLSSDVLAISAGVAIFLFGMLALEQGFNAFTGGTLERMLRRVTSNRWKCLGFGLVSTALMQSSSLVSVITISFLSSGLITLAAGIGIVFGANLGTTTGAWLIAGFGLKVDIAAYAMPMLVFGVVLIFQSSKRLVGIGYVLAGLGFLFLGIHHMKEGFEAFRDSIDLAQYAMTGYSGVFAFTLLGIFATVVMQSSHATLVLTITALAAGQITYENALALAIGANVGTTVTAILGSLSANESGKRLAVAHLAFNLVTGLIAVGFVFQLVELVNWLSAGIGISDDDYTLKLAVFHTIFNLIGIIVMFPLVGWLERNLVRIMPEKSLSVDQPKYLSIASAEFSDTAAEAVRKETRRVYDNAVAIVVRGLGISDVDFGPSFHTGVTLEAQRKPDFADIEPLYEKHVKTIYSAIIAFISETSFPRNEEQSMSLQWLRDASKQSVEAVKDAKHLQKNFKVNIQSANADVREAYERLGKRLAGTIQTLQNLALSTDAQGQAGGAIDMLSLDSLKLEIEMHQQSMTEQMSELIGSHRITPLMGSSLFNDSEYAHSICTNLIRAAQTLFGAGNPDLLTAAKDVTLDESDLAELRELRALRAAAEQLVNSGKPDT